MKRNLENLTKEELRWIKEWTEISSKTKQICRCPFSREQCTCYLGGQRCKELFPSIQPTEKGFFTKFECPCLGKLKHSYVLKIAKQIVKEVQR